MADRPTSLRWLTILLVGSASTVVWVLDRGPAVLSRPGPVVLWGLMIGASWAALWPLVRAPRGRAVTTVLLGGVLTAQLVAVLTEWVWVPCAVLGASALLAAAVAWRSVRFAGRLAAGSRAVETRLTALIGAFTALDEGGQRVDDAGRGTAAPAAPTRRQDRARLALVVVALGVGALVAIRDLRWVLYDDAAITLRYAWRLAEGLGFTYNDGDRTNGASAPLYTLLLALIRAIGGDLVSAAKVVGVITYASSLALVAAIVGRVARVGAAVLAVLVVLASADFRLEVLSGMESGLSAVLGLAVILCLLDRRDTLAGVLLGLAVVNKLDGAILAVGVLGAIVVVQHRLPRRLALVSVGVAAPWFIFSAAYFGSPVPYSATQKLTEVGDPASGHDPLWVLRTMQGDGQALVLLVALSATAWLACSAGAHLRLRLAATASGFWFGGHLVAFSVIDLGDPYPWYVTVLYPAAAVAAALGAAALLSQLRASSRVATVDAVVLGAGTIALLVLPLMPGIRATASVVVHGHTPDPYERFEATRREAGRYLAEQIGPDDVVETCWGWVAYGVPTNPIRETCPLSTRREVGPASWAVSSTWMEAEPFAPPATASLVARFRSCGDPSGSTDVIRLAVDPGTAEDPASPTACLDGS